MCYWTRMISWDADYDGAQMGLTRQLGTQTKNTEAVVWDGKAERQNTAANNKVRLGVP